MITLFFHRIVDWNSEHKEQLNQLMSCQWAFSIVISGYVWLPVLSVQVFSNPGERTELFLSLWACIWTMFSIMMTELHKFHLHNILVLWCLSITATIQRAWGQICWFHMPSLKLLWVSAHQRNAHVQSSAAPHPPVSEANEAEELWALFLFFLGSTNLSSEHQKV